MFDYINYGGLGVMLFLAVIIAFSDSIGKDKTVSWGFYIILMILVGVLLFEGNSKYTTSLDNIDKFQNKNATLKCIVGGGMYSSSNKYRVSQKDGWTLDKRYFIKDSLMVKASRCEEW
jgi:hypothetical protein